MTAVSDPVPLIPAPSSPAICASIATGTSLMLKFARVCRLSPDQSTSKSPARRRGLPCALKLLIDRRPRE